MVYKGGVYGWCNVKFKQNLHLCRIITNFKALSITALFYQIIVDLGDLPSSFDRRCFVRFPEVYPQYVAREEKAR